MSWAHHSTQLNLIESTICCCYSPFYSCYCYCFSSCSCSALASHFSALASAPSPVPAPALSTFASVSGCQIGYIFIMSELPELSLYLAIWKSHKSSAFGALAKLFLINNFHLQKISSQRKVYRYAALIPSPPPHGVDLLYLLLFQTYLWTLHYRAEGHEET